MRWSGDGGLLLLVLIGRELSTTRNAWISHAAEVRYPQNGVACARDRAATMSTRFVYPRDLRADSGAQALRRDQARRQPGAGALLGAGGTLRGSEGVDGVES